MQQLGRNSARELPEAPFEGSLPLRLIFGPQARQIPCVQVTEQVPGGVLMSQCPSYQGKPSLCEAIETAIIT